MQERWEQGGGREGDDFFDPAWSLVGWGFAAAAAIGGLIWVKDMIQILVG